MDLYEYQARELLEEQGIPTPKAVFAQNSHEVAEAAEQIGYPNVIKAQVKIGHRGQAGGVRLAKNRDEAILASEGVLPMTIHKHKVSGVLVAEAKNILHEYYVSISVDRSSRDFDVLATANGGTEVEEIAKEHPGIPSSVCILTRLRISTSKRLPRWLKALASIMPMLIRPHRSC